MSKPQGGNGPCTRRWIDVGGGGFRKHTNVRRDKITKQSRVHKLEQFGANNVPGLKCHSWCSEDDASVTSMASTATGKSFRAGRAMTTVTHLVTCREKHGRPQAYLGGKTARREHASVDNWCRFPFSWGSLDTQTFIKITIRVLIVCQMV